MASTPLLQIERAIARAWPADELVEFGGWWWRCSGGGFGRANSVATLGSPPADIGLALDDIEQRYQAAGLPTLIQVTDASEPPDLAQILLGCGYVVSETNATMALDITAGAAGFATDAGIETSAVGDVEIATDAGAPWIATYATVLDDLRRASAPRILARVPEPRRMIGVRRDGRHVATVLLVAAGPIAVVECVATLPEARRSGVARFAMLAAIREAERLGATSIALGMVAANVPARGLYEALGFREIGLNRYFRKEKT